MVIKRIQIEAIATLLITFKAQMNILFNTKVKILMFSKWSCRSSLIVLIIKPRMVSIFLTCNPIFFEGMSFKCWVLDPHTTT